MKLEYLPLLEVQLGLQRLPRNSARFHEYLRIITNRDGIELPPLGIMNPMGKEHVTALLEALVALDADRLGAQATVAAEAALAHVPGEAKIGLVVADDLLGGWTNRYDYEFTLRFGGGLTHCKPDVNAPSGFSLPRWLKHFWLTAVLWSSEPASARAVREAILLPAYRLAYVHRHGPAKKLRDLLAQEGWVMKMADCPGPVLDDDDLAYTREVLQPYLETSDKRTVIECLCGDEAGRTLGFTPRGLSPWAGLALALHDARSGHEKC